MGQYDSFFEDYEVQRMRAQSAGIAASSTLTHGLNPDTIAKSRQTASALGVPPAVVEAAPEDAQRQAEVQRIDRDTATTPVLRQRYTDTDFMKLARDDSGVLAGVESALRKFGSAAVDVGKYVASAPDAPGGGVLSDVARAARAIASGAPKAGAGLYGAAAAPFELLGLSTLGGFLRDQQHSADAEAARWSPQDPNAGLIERGVMSGLQSGGQNLITLPLGFAARGEQMMLGAMGVITAGQSYGKGRDAGLSPARAVPYAVQDAAAEVITERYLGASGFLKQIKAGASAGRLFMYELAREVPGEMAATLWQNFNEWTNVNPDKSVADFIKEQPAALAETAIATLVGGTTQIGAVKAIERAVAGVTGQERQAQRAEAGAQLVDQLAKLQEASKLAQRAPDHFVDLVRQISEEGPAPTEFYVDREHLANTLAQSGVDPQHLAAAAPTLVQQLEDAVPGADVRLPVAELAALGPQFTQPLLDHLRASPEAMSRAEAQEFIQTQGDQIKGQVEQLLAQHEDTSAFKQQVQEASAQFEQELAGAGRFRPEVNKAYASLLGNFYAAQAERAGVPLPEMLERYQLRVASNAPGGGAALDLPATATPAPEKQRAMIDLRKREAVLRSLVECMG